MPLTKAKCFELAIKNIAQYGDTDVFPYPIENLIFFDDSSGVVGVLKGIDNDFAKSLETFPFKAVQTLSAVGYSGFRLGKL